MNIPNMTAFSRTGTIWTALRSLRQLALIIGGNLAVSLLFGIIVTVVWSSLRHVRPNMTAAYRQIALPAALVAGGVILVLVLTMEIRHYRQSKTLAQIARVS